MTMLAALTMSVVEEARDQERSDYFAEKAREQAAWHAEHFTGLGAETAAHWLRDRDDSRGNISADHDEAGMLLAEVERLRARYPRGGLGRPCPPADPEPPYAHDTSLLCGVRLLPEETRRPFRMDAYTAEVALGALTAPAI